MDKAGSSGGRSGNMAVFVTVFCCLSVTAVLAIEDPYSNSFISPNSAEQPMVDSSKPLDLTSTQTDILTSQPDPTTLPHTPSHPPHGRPPRSADPVVHQTASSLDDLLTFKDIGDSVDSNDVELSGRVYNMIQPSKTVKEQGGSEGSQTRSGEYQGAPQGRSIPLSEPQEIAPTATMTGGFATQLSPLGRGRQANPDIQDLITGIVKFLHGNGSPPTNTALPAMARPVRPVSTRINNRGPPRITDVPALPPDFDVPAPPLPPPPLGQLPPPVSTTRMPTPYPFDIPPQNTSPVRPYVSGVPIPEPIVPTSGKRPGFYRPVTIPPWSRPPYRKPGSNRRPLHPPYKRIPPYNPDSSDVSITSDRPSEDILTLDLGSQLESTIENEEGNGTEEDLNTQQSSIEEFPVEDVTEAVVNTTEVQDKEILEFEKNKEKSASKMEKHTSKTEATPSTPAEVPPSTSDPISLLSNSTSEEISSSSDLPLPSSVVEVAPTIMDANSTVSESANVTTDSAGVSGVGEATPLLESSIQEVLQTLKDNLLDPSTMSSTPTESLPQVSLASTESSSSSSLTSKDSSMASSSSPSPPSSSAGQSSQQGFPYYPYRPRPGIVLDDTEYKPGVQRQPIITRPPIGQLGDIFDITVSAIQGPGGSSAGGQGKPYIIPVAIENINVGQNADVITRPVGDEGFVSIDGKRTYLNLFGDNTIPPTSVASALSPTPTVNDHISGTGYAVVETEKPTKPVIGKNPGVGVKPTPRRPVFRRPNQPPVRIDTCIVGDDSTCDASQHEICRTEAGVSACHCRPGHARRKHRDPCRKVVSVLVSLRVDRLYERRVNWVGEFTDRNSDSYQQLSYETERAMESAMSMTPFSDEFLGARVNSIYRGDRAAGQAGVFVNLTLQLEENLDTARPTIRGDIQRHLLGVIQRRSHNVGNSAVWVESPAGAVSNLQDLDECSSPDLHDCHALATCINVFGGFKCECGEGFRDPWADNKHRAGRFCEQCSPQHCNNRGECKYQNGQEVCVCTGNYYGAQCELDGEVLGVAIGASIAAVIIIGLTLVCLVMWSRRWNREQKAAVGSPVFGYMATASNTVKTPPMGAPPYQLTLEDRLRWAQIADVMAQANHYAPEPVPAPTRPSSAMFGYPSLAGTLQHGLHGTLPPVPLPRLNLQAQFAGRAASVHSMRPLDNSSSSEEEDKADLLGRNFQVPRPKSRSNASIANQSGIYYDVDYDQNDIYKHQTAGIPLSTYTVGRASYYRN